MNNAKMGRRRSSKWRKDENRKETKSKSSLFFTNNCKRRSGFLEKVCPSSLESSLDSLENVPDPDAFDKTDEVCTRDNIQVLLRIRPKNQRERELNSKTILKALNSSTIMFDPKQETVEFFFHGMRQKVYDYKDRPKKNLRFAFDHVFSPGQSNVEIFDDAVKPIVNHVLRGFNCSVFAYGATGSGKTYTMLGSAENPGLTFLMAKELSQRIREMANEFESEIVVSYLEVYNETIKDLLYPSGLLSIREDLSGVNVPNLTMHKIKDTCDLLRMLSFGNNARTQHPTDHNAESSRSHAVFQVFVTLRKRITHLSLNYKIVKAKLVMVDLAGSERGSTSGSDCQRCREGGSINKSLLALGNCINALADGRKHIPYRDSKLTRLLKDALGGNCKTVMIANVAPTGLNYDESYNTLRYANRAKQIRVTVKQNLIKEPVSHRSAKVVGDLQNEISQLKLLLQQERQTNLGLREQPRLNPIPGYSSTTSFVSISAAIHNPEALEKFIQLLDQKKKLEEAHVDASITARESEWNLLWQKYKLESISHLVLDENYEPKHATCDKLKTVYQTLIQDYDHCQEKVQLTRRLLEFNEKELNLIEKTFLSMLSQDAPFLPVTLHEFLYYKNLERELGTQKNIGNFHQQLSNRMIHELAQRERLLGESLECIEDLKAILEKNSIPVKKTMLRRIVDHMLGESCLDESFRNETLLSMAQMVRSPVVQYDRSDSDDPVHPTAGFRSAPEPCNTPTEASVDPFDHTSPSEHESERNIQQSDDGQSEFECPLSLSPVQEDDEDQSSKASSTCSFPQMDKLQHKLTLSGNSLFQTLNTRTGDAQLSSQCHLHHEKKKHERNSKRSVSSEKIPMRKEGQKPISFSARKLKSDCVPRPDYSTSLDKGDRDPPPRKDSELFSAFQNMQKSTTTPILIQDQVLPQKSQLSPTTKSLQTSVRPSSHNVSKPNDKTRETTYEAKLLPIAQNPHSPKCASFQKTDVAKKEISSSSTTTTAPVKKPVRKKRKNKSKPSGVKATKKITKTKKKSPICKPTSTELKIKTQLSTRIELKNVAENASSQKPADPPVQPNSQLDEPQTKKSAADRFTSTQMFAKASQAAQVTSTTTLRPVFKDVKSEVTPQPKPPMFQRLILGKSVKPEAEERNSEVKVETCEKQPEKAISPRPNQTNETPKSCLGQHGSKEDFWNNGMFIPSSAPESALSEDQFTPQKVTCPLTFVFSDAQYPVEPLQPNRDQTLIGRSERCENRKSQIPLPNPTSGLIPPPSPMSPCVQKPPNPTKVLALSAKNLQARERGWDDNFWKTGSDCMGTVSGNGDLTFRPDEEDQDTQIVKPPPGYEPTDTSFYTHLLTRPPPKRFS